MNCREFASFVIDLGREQLPTPTHALARQHAEQCASCATRLAQEQALWADIRLLADSVAQQEAPAWIEANLLTALREQAVQKPVVVAPMARWWVWPFAAGVAVAAVLLVVSLAVGRRQKVEDARVQQASKSTSTSLPPKAETAQDVSLPSAPKAVRTAVRRLPARRAIRPIRPPLVEELPFYSLVTEGEMVPLESGRIVRIEVPPATLVNLGVPLTDTTLTQPVQADLLLGQDGLARAIRLLPYPQTTRTQ